MNTSFFMNMKSIFLKSGQNLFRSAKTIIKSNISGFIIIAFASILILSCNDNQDGGAKKTDPATQSNEQRGDDNKEGKDTSHEGMDHDAPGMDTMHREKQK